MPDNHSRGPKKRTTEAAPAPAGPIAALLAAAAEKAVAGKLRKASNVDKTLRQLAPKVEPAVLFWNLAGRGLLTLADVASNDALESMAESVPEAEPLIAFCARLTECTARGLSDLMPSVSVFLSNAVATSYAVSPSPWEAALASLPTRVQDVVLLARVKTGALERVPAADRERLLAELIAYMAKEEDLRATDDTIEAFGESPHEIGRRQVPLLLAHTPSKPFFFAEGLVLVPWERFVSILNDVAPWDVGLLVSRLLPRRADVSAADLIAWARRRLAGLDANQAFAICMILTAAKSREPGLVPGPEYDEAFALRLVDHDWESVVPLMPGIPRDRVLGIYQRARAAVSPASPHHRGYAYPLLRFAFDEAHVREAIEETRAIEAMAPEPLGRIGLRALPLLEHAYAKASPTQRHTFRVALAAAVASADGEPVPDRCDVFLSPDEADGYANDLDRAPWPILASALAALPEARGRALIDRWLAADRDGNAEVRNELERRLPDRARAWLPPAEPLADRLRRLVRDTGLPADTRLYLLTPIDAVQPSLLRTASRPLGLPAQRVPQHGGRPMEHVITLDLAAMPELARRAGSGKARALAVFISSRRRHSAFRPGTSQTAVVLLTETEAAAGHANEGGGYQVEAIDVPLAAFGDDHDTTAVASLRKALLNAPGWAGAAPLWIQEPEASAEEVLAQCSDKLVSGLNVGDQGMLYVLSSTAFVQSG